MRYLSALIFCLVTTSCLLGRPYPPVLITLDHNNDFVLTGNGQLLSGIQFKGPRNITTFESAPGSQLFQDPETGELVGSAPRPFQFLLAGNSETVAYGSVAGALPSEPLDGSFPLLFGPTDIGLLNQIDILVGYQGYITPYDNPFGFMCETCDFPDASFTADGGIEVTNINQPIIRFTVFSNEGRLTEVTDFPIPGSEIVKSTATRLTVEKLTGFLPAELEQLNVFSGVAPSTDTFVQLDLEGGRSFGPIPMAAAIPEPEGIFVFLGGAFALLQIRRRRDNRV